MHEVEYNNLTEADIKTAHALEKWVEEGWQFKPMTTLADAAEKMGISPWQLSYYCQAYLGMNFLAWRRALRIEEAMRLIRENPDRTLVSVRYAVGIEEKANFRRAFFEHCRMTPGEYRTRCRRWKRRE